MYTNVYQSFIENVLTEFVYCLPLYWHGIQRERVNVSGIYRLLSSVFSTLVTKDLDYNSPVMW